MHTNIIMQRGTVGTSMRLRTTSASIFKLGQRCYICHVWIHIVNGIHVEDRFWNGHWYCAAHYLQASHGIELSIDGSNWFTKKCKVCGKKIGRIYDFCYIHSPRRKMPEDVKEKFRISNLQRDTTYNPQGTLRKDLAFCQNVNCCDRKPIPRNQMFRVARKCNMFPYINQKSDKKYEME